VPFLRNFHTQNHHEGKCFPSIFPSDGAVPYQTLPPERRSKKGGAVHHRKLCRKKKFAKGASRNRNSIEDKGKGGGGGGEARQGCSSRSSTAGDDAKRRRRSTNLGNAESPQGEAKRNVEPSTFGRRIWSDNQAVDRRTTSALPKRSKTPFVSQRSQGQKKKCGRTGFPIARRTRKVGDSATNTPRNLGPLSNQQRRGVPGPLLNGPKTTPTNKLGRGSFLVLQRSVIPILK